jgi:hypothetical protein
VPSRVLIVLGAVVFAALGAYTWFAIHPRPEKPAAVAAPAAASPAPVAPSTPAVSAAPVEPAPTAKKPAAAAPATKPEPAPAVVAPAAPTTATIRFISDVPDTSVFIDRVYLGTAPITAPSVSPGSHQVKMVAAGYDSVSETIDVVPGPRDFDVKFKEVKLDVKLEVTHKHGVGSCSGTLSATPQGIRYVTSAKEDAFSVPLADLEVFEVDYLNKNLKVKLRKGKTFNFTNADANADRLYTFHAEVEKARKRLTTG